MYAIAKVHLIFIFTTFIKEMTMGTILWKEEAANRGLSTES